MIFWNFIAIFALLAVFAFSAVIVVLSLHFGGIIAVNTKGINNVVLGERGVSVKLISVKSLIY